MHAHRKKPKRDLVNNRKKKGKNSYSKVRGVLERSVSETISRKYRKGINLLQA